MAGRIGKRASALIMAQQQRRKISSRGISIATDKVNNEVTRTMNTVSEIRNLKEKFATDHRKDTDVKEMMQ